MRCSRTCPARTLCRCSPSRWRISTRTTRPTTSSISRSYEKLGRLQGVIASTVARPSRRASPRANCPGARPSLRWRAWPSFRTWPGSIRPASSFDALRRAPDPGRGTAAHRPLRRTPSARSGIAGRSPERTSKSSRSPTRRCCASGASSTISLLEEREFLAAKAQLEQDVAEWRAAVGEPQVGRAALRQQTPAHARVARYAPAGPLRRRAAIHQSERRQGCRTTSADHGSPSLRHFPLDLGGSALADGALSGA